MPWSTAQIILAHTVQRERNWSRADYLLILRNIAGIRPYNGAISSKNPSATDRGFERFMAYAESQGFIDLKHGEGYWSHCAAEETRKVKHRIRQLHDQAVAAKLIQPDSLPAFIYRQTQKRDAGPTQNLDECDPTWCSKILEGLKAWLYPEARRRGISLDL